MTTADPTATTPLLRRLNVAAVLEYLMGAADVTGTQVMAATGLSRPTVHTACEHLIGLGWVTELDGRRPEGDGRPGRPARCYQFNAEAGYVVGVDLGEHKVSVMLTDLRGDTIAVANLDFSNPNVSASNRIASTRRAIREALKSSGVNQDKVLAASIGVAAPVTCTGRVIASADDSYMSGMADMDIAKSVGRGYDWPILLENDANLAVLGERWKGAGIGIDDLIVILSGERLGAGLFLGGQLVRGYNGGAGELTFLEMVEGMGDTIGIGAFARIEGEKAVARLAQHSPRPAGRAGAGPHSLFARAGGVPDMVTGDMVTAAAQSGDPVALTIMDAIAERVSRVVAVLSTMLNPEMVVIGGASSGALSPIHKHITNRLPLYTKQPPPRLEATQLGDRGVLLGAVRLALDHVQTHVFDALN